MAFDPEAYAAKATATPAPASGSGGFDPEAYAAKVNSQAPQDLWKVATNPDFDPVEHVRANPDDQNAINLAAQVQEYRNKNTPFIDKAAKVAKGAWDATEGLIPALAHDTLATGKNILANFGNSYVMDNENASPEAKAQADADSLAMVGGFKSGWETTKHLGRLTGRALSPSPDIEEIKSRLITDAQGRTANQAAIEGHAIAGVNPEDLKAQGATITPPEDVAGIGNTLNPVNAAALVAGPLAGRAVGALANAAPKAVGEIAVKSMGKFITPEAEAAVRANAEAATTQAMQNIGDRIAAAPQQVIGGALQGLGVTGKAAQGVASAIADNDIAGLVLGDRHKYLSRIARYGSDALEGVADFGKNIRENGLPAPQGVLGRTAANAAGQAGKGALAGTAVSALPALGSENPEEAGQILGGGAGFGALGGLGDHLTSGKAFNAYFDAVNDPKLKGVLSSESAPYGTNPQMDALHEQAMAALPGEKQAEINRARNLMAGGAEVYVLPKDQFQKVAGQDSHGVYYENGKIYLNQDTVALGHETGHAVESDLRANDPARLESLYNNIKEEDLQPFVDEYNKRLLADNPKATPISLNSPDAKSEYLAEQIQNTLQGKPFKQLGATDRFGTLLVGSLGRFIERTTGSPMTDVKTAIGAKPTFASDKLIRDYLDQKARTASQLKEQNGPTSTGTAKASQAGTPEQPVAAKTTENVTASIAERAREADARTLQSLNAGRERGGYVFPPNSEVLNFQYAAGSAADLLGEGRGRLSSPDKVQAYLSAHLMDSPLWKSLKSEEKAAIADYIVDHEGRGIHELFEAPALTSAANEKPVAVAEAPEPRVGTGGEKPSEPIQETIHIPARKVTPNVRVGETKAKTPEFERQVDNDFNPPSQEVGLVPAVKRKLEKDGSISMETKDYLVGKGFNEKDPEQAKLLADAKAHAPNPAVFNEAVRSITDAIQKGKNISLNYLSAAREAEGVPTSFESGQAQKEANVGLVSRKELEKTISPNGFEVRPAKKEAVFTKESVNNAILKAREYYQKAANNKSYKPAFDDLRQAVAAIRDIAKKRAAGKPLGDYEYAHAAEVEKFLDKEERPVVYVTGYSPDKVIANGHNLAKALSESGYEKDPIFKDAIAYLKSKQFPEDLYIRNQNMTHGYRADGKEFLNTEGKDALAGRKDPSFKPVELDDKTVQILNAVEGGPSATYYPEANANAPSAGRAPVENPKEQGANPFMNSLKGLGKDLKITRPSGPVEGIGNILDSASEIIRLDRVSRVHGASDISVPPSQYSQRAAGFMPKGEKDPISEMKLEYPYGIENIQYGRPGEKYRAHFPEGKYVNSRNFATLKEAEDFLREKIHEGEDLENNFIESLHELHWANTGEGDYSGNRNFKEPRIAANDTYERAIASNKTPALDQIKEAAIKANGGRPVYRGAFVPLPKIGGKIKSYLGSWTDSEPDAYGWSREDPTGIQVDYGYGMPKKNSVPVVFKVDNPEKVIISHYDQDQFLPENLKGKIDPVEDENEINLRGAQYEVKNVEEKNGYHLVTLEPKKLGILGKEKAQFMPSGKSNIVDLTDGEADHWLFSHANVVDAINGSLDESKLTKPEAEEINSAAKKIKEAAQKPSGYETLYRGISLPGEADVKKIFPDGKVIETREYYSAATDPGSGKSYAETYRDMAHEEGDEGHVPVVIHMAAKPGNTIPGAVVEGMGKDQGETEVILPPNTKFAVQSVKKQKDGSWVIRVAEAEGQPQGKFMARGVKQFGSYEEAADALSSMKDRKNRAVVLRQDPQDWRNQWYEIGEKSDPEAISGEGQTKNDQMLMKALSGFGMDEPR